MIERLRLQLAMLAVLAGPIFSTKAARPSRMFLYRSDGGGPAEAGTAINVMSVG
jgi:hypothetical protein